ncbi:AMP-binding protein, partial [Streptomyces sp. URMC 123]|uniref:AMP-binding protein n=1 Tax=Streptomyces sp. URMC 123 TaxID=3423403 RepID=UPI003F1D9546
MPRARNEPPARTVTVPVRASRAYEPPAPYGHGTVRTPARTTPGAGRRPAPMMALPSRRGGGDEEETVRQLSYASGCGTEPLLGDTIGRHLARVAERFGDREALVDCAGGRRWTYAAFDRAVDDVGRGLLALGVAKGDRVALWSGNAAEWALTQFAAARAGAVLVSLNPAYGPVELAYTLRQAGASVLIAGTGFKGADCRDTVRRVRPGCP